MYLPPHFTEADPAEADGLIAAFPLATLVTQTEEGLVANRILSKFNGRAHGLDHRRCHAMRFR